MYELLDTPTPEPLPRTLGDLTPTQMRQLVDAYAIGNVVTMRQATHLSTWICREAHERLETLKQLVLAYIRANPTTTKAAMLQSLAGAAIGMPAAVGVYAVDKQQATSCATGDWLDFRAAVIASAPAEEVAP